MGTINTKLNMHDKVVTLIDGHIISLEIDEINFRIVPVDEKDGGVIEYSGRRRDKGIDQDSPFDKRNIKFRESDLGRTFWRTKVEMIDHLSALDVETDCWK